jgi:hypothetical protein
MALISVFVYNPGGIPFFTRIYEGTEAENLNLFTSFFTAIQALIKELSSSATDELNHLKFHSSEIIFGKIPEFDLYLTFRTSNYKQDSRTIKKASKLITSYFLERPEAFRSWDGYQLMSFPDLEEKLDKICKRD